MLVLSEEFGQKSVYTVLGLYFLLLLGIIFIFLFEPGGYGWKGELYGSLILAGITLVFVFSDLKDFKRYLFPDRLNGLILLASVLLTPLFSFLVSNVVSWMNWTFFNENPSMFDWYSDAANPLMYAIIFTAVFPAFFEELAFRGVIFSRGRAVFSLKQSILISAILFTFLHLSPLSFLWIFPFALVLGWLRAKYRTTFYGIIIHFIHNLTAVMLEYYGYDNLL